MYDSFNRSKLWEILIQKVLKGKILDMLQAMHTDVFAAVKLGLKNEITYYLKYTNGAKQGCVLTAILFSIYIPKLESIFKNSGFDGIQLKPNDVELFLFMYIDNICIFSDKKIDLQIKN